MGTDSPRQPLPPRPLFDPNERFRTLVAQSFGPYLTDLPPFSPEHPSDEEPIVATADRIRQAVGDVGDAIDRQYAEADGVDDAANRYEVRRWVEFHTIPVRLAEPDRTVWLLGFYLGLSDHETATQLCIPPATARETYRRAERLVYRELTRFNSTRLFELPDGAVDRVLARLLVRCWNPRDKWASLREPRKLVDDIRGKLFADQALGPDETRRFFLRAAEVVLKARRNATDTPIDRADFSKLREEDDRFSMLRTSPAHEFDQTVLLARYAGRSVPEIAALLSLPEQKVEVHRARFQTLVSPM